MGSTRSCLSNISIVGEIVTFEDNKKHKELSIVVVEHMSITKSSWFEGSLNHHQNALG